MLYEIEIHCTFAPTKKYKRFLPQIKNVACFMNKTFVISLDALLEKHFLLKYCGRTRLLL